MLLSSPKVRLITFFKTRLIKFHLNSYFMTDPIYGSTGTPRPPLCLKKQNELKKQKSCIFEYFYHKITSVKGPERKALKSILENGANAGYQHFLLFSNCFLPVVNQISVCLSHLFCRLQVVSISSVPKHFRLVKS